METKLREALDVSNGAISGLVNEPLAVVVYLLVLLALVAPAVLSLRTKGTPNPTDQRVP